MKVHLRQIPVEGLHLEGEEETDILDLDDPTYRPIGTVAYSLQVGVSGSGVFATGRVSINVECECVKCLKRFVYPLVVDPFAAQVELTGPELVDLTPQIREDILLVLPPHPRCDWDGETVCRGPRLTRKVVEPKSSAAEAWGALDDLQLRLRN